MLIDDKIEKLFDLVELEHNYKGHIVDYRKHIIKNDTAIMTMAADRYWNTCLSQNKMQIFFNKNHKITTYYYNTKEKINELIDVLEANIIENNIEYSLNSTTDGLKELEQSLHEELDNTLNKILKPSDNKEEIMVNSNNILYLLSFNELSKKMLNQYMKEKIIEPLKTNKQYQKYINPKNYIPENKLEYKINGDITGFLYDNKNLDIIFEKEYGEWKLLKENSYYQLETSINKLLKNIIYNEFKKHPNIAKKIYEYTLLRKRKENIKNIFEMADNFKTNLSILKAEKINIVEVLSPMNTVEKIEDTIKEIEIKHQSKKLIKGLLSNKYKNLMGFKEESSEKELDYTKAENYKYFKELVGLKITPKELQDSIGSKLSRYKNSQELGEALVLYINSFNDFNMKAMKNKIKNFNAEIIKEDEKNNQLILKIKDYEASNALGSQSWCISYSEKYFKSYTKDDATQYFIYDFKKEFDDEYSMVGITLNKKNELKDAYDKHDYEIKKKEYDLTEKIELIKKRKTNQKFNKYNKVNNF